MAEIKRVHQLNGWRSSGILHKETPSPATAERHCLKRERNLCSRALNCPCLAWGALGRMVEMKVCKAFVPRTFSRHQEQKNTPGSKRIKVSFSNSCPAERRLLLRYLGTASTTSSIGSFQIRTVLVESSSRAKDTFSPKLSLCSWSNQ